MGGQMSLQAVNAILGGGGVAAAGSTQIGGASVYIDMTASVNGDGTAPNTPSNTFPATLTPGKSYLFPYGMDWMAPVALQALNIGQSGTATSRIIIGAYGDPTLGKPILRCSNVARGINIGIDVAFVTIRDLRITNVAGGTSRRGITNATTGSSSAINTSLFFVGLTVDNVIDDGANECAGMQLWGSNNKVISCEIDEIADDGLWYKGHGFEASYNLITNIAKSGRVAGDNIQCGGASDNGWIHHNYLDHSNNNTKQCYIHNTASDGLVFEDNTCIGPSSGVTFSTLMFSAVTGLKVRRNKLFGGANVHISPACVGAEITSNLVINSYGRGIDMNAQGVIVRNNTIIGVSAPNVYGIRHTNTAHTECVAQNNLLIDWARGIQATTGASAASNAYWDCATNISGITSGGGDITSDPQVTANGELTPSSPLLQAGQYYGDDIDIDGVPRSNPPSIGAYEAPSP
jgi:hypothetical protein